MKTSAVVFLIVLAIFLLLIGPFITIWALNILFGLSIPTTFDTWLAVFWLGLFFVAKPRS